MIELRNLTKIYNANTDNQVIALDHVSFTLPESGMVFLLGKSGSGKTTMLNLLGGLDAPSEGELCIDGVSSAGFRQKDWDAYRNNYVGIVFQEYNLLDDLTIGANIALALNLQGKISKADAEQKIAAVLEQVGLSGYGSRKPGELSGGQKQRIAIARALVKNPQMILADEPTGALDSENGQQIFDLLKEISKEKLVVIVSHDEESARKYADRIIELADGSVVSDSTQAKRQQVSYHPNMVRVPANYVFTDEEWTVLQDYLQACLRGENPTPPTEEAEAELASVATSSAEQRVFKVKKSSLPIIAAAKMALESMKKRRLRLSLVTVLCTLAFLLVGVSDLITAYDRRAALIKSLSHSEFDQIAITKEQYLDYDMTKISPLLPTQKALDTFSSSTLVFKPGKPGWYDGYMLNDADLQDLSDRTGVTFKGVYVPPYEFLNIETHYPPLIDTSNKAYISELTGIMDFTQADLDLFGFTMTAGRLPDGDKDEIAVSKHVYETFATLGYKSYDFDLEIPYYSKKPVPIQIGPNAFELPPMDRNVRVSWTEFSANNFQFYRDLLEEISSTGGDLDPGFIKAMSTLTSIKTITCPEDLLGCTLLLENRHYTITGIIDTGFDPAAENGGVGSKTLTEQEQDMGMAYLAFVGQGKTAEIAARYPTAIMLKDFSMTLSFTTNTGELTPVSNNTLARFSDLNADLVRIPEKRSSQQMWVSNGFSNNWRELYGQHIQKLPYRMNALRSGSEARLFASRWQNEFLRLTDLGQACYQIDFSLDFHCKVSSFDCCSFKNFFFLDDFAFDLLTEGRAGTYQYAIGVLPHNESAVANLVNGAWDESDDTRYKLESLVTYELDYLNGTLLILAKIFRYIGLGMALFAAVIFWNFITTGIRQRKREIGILRALGANGSDVFRVFFTESFILAAANTLLASLLTFMACPIGNWILQNMMQSRLVLFSPNLRQVGIIFALSFGIAIVSSLIPILRIAQQKPIDAIRE